MSHEFEHDIVRWFISAAWLVVAQVETTQERLITYKSALSIFYILVEWIQDCAYLGPLSGNQCTTCLIWHFQCRESYSLVDDCLNKVLQDHQIEAHGFSDIVHESTLCYSYHILFTRDIWASQVSRET